MLTHWLRFIKQGQIDFNRARFLEKTYKRNVGKEVLAIRACIVCVREGEDDDVCDNRHFVRSNVTDTCRQMCV